MRIYRHSFAGGDPGGWLGWRSNAEGAERIRFEGGAAISSSPWWVDYNHAPPGGGYLHLPYALHTFHPPGFPEQYRELGGENRFVAEGFPRDFRNAILRFTLKGELELRGAQLLLLVQSKTGGKYVNYILTGQPMEVTPEWNCRTLHLTPDPAQWTCIGSRHDRRAFYGDAPVEDVLADVNGDIILVLFPLDVRPADPIDGDPHRLRAGEEYPVDGRYLPAGNLRLQSVEIEFPETAETR